MAPGSWKMYYIFPFRSQNSNTEIFTITFLGVGFGRITNSQKVRTLYLESVRVWGHIAYTELLSCPTWSDTKQPHKAPVMVAHTSHTLPHSYVG